MALTPAPGYDGPLPTDWTVTWEVSLSLIASERVVGCLELLDYRGQSREESAGVICVVDRGNNGQLCKYC